MKKLSVLFASLFLFAAFCLSGCTADYNTFDQSDYRTMNEIHFVEEAGSPAVYTSAHKIAVTTVAPPDSEDTWDSVTVSDIDISSLASIHLVESKFQSFPTDSASLDSLANAVAYAEDDLVKNDKIRVPASHQVYVVIVSESGKTSLWQIEFTIPGVAAVSSSSADGGSDAGSSSSADGSSSSAATGASSSSAKVSSDVSLTLGFEGALSTSVSGDTISVEFAQGTDLSAVVFDTAIVYRKSSVSPDPAAIQDWTEVKKLTVTAEDGTEKTWTVIVSAVKSSATDLHFTFENQLKVNSSGDTIALKFVYGNTVAEAKLDSFSVSAGASVSPDPDSVKTWKDFQSFVVTAEDGTAKTWVLALSVAEETETASSDKSLLSISADGEIATATIDSSAKTAVLHLSDAAALSSVTVSVSVSATASHNFGTAAIDLRTPQTLTITAEDNSSASWTVSADYPKASGADILSFSTDDFDSAPVIDADRKTVTFEIPYSESENADKVYFTATYSAGASKTTPSGDYLDLSSGSATLVVSAEDGTSATWTVKASIAAVAPQLLSVSIGAGKVAGTIDQTTGTVFFDMTYATDLDLRTLAVQSISLSDGATTSDIAKGTSYDFSKKKTVTVSNSAGNSKTYTLQAGYQYPGSDFNTWVKDAFGNMNDVDGWDNGNNSVSSIVTSTKTLTVNEDLKIVKMTTNTILGNVASGNMFTGYFDPKDNLTITSTSDYEDGNELIDFGRPFYGRPQYVELDVHYSGLGDSCDLYVLLESRTLQTNEGKNQYRTSSDVNTLVASAWYRASTVEDETDPDVVSIVDASLDGYKTIRLKLQYGVPLTGSPIYASSAFNVSLKNSSGIDNHLVSTESPDDFDVTHIRIVMASSANGNQYDGKKNATLYCDEIRLIY